MKNLQPGTALRNGERERILIRCREALARYRGAALRYRFGAGIMMAVLQKHILSRFQFLNLRVRAQRRTSHVALAGVYWLNMLVRSGGSGKCFMWQGKNAAAVRKCKMLMMVK